MNQKDKKAWSDKTQKLNQHFEIKVGMGVKDVEGYKGIVVKIIEPDDEQNHGTIYVWQSDRTDYGADNCEHYSFQFWKSMLRITDNPYQALMEKIQLESSIEKTNDEDNKDKRGSKLKL